MYDYKILMRWPFMNKELTALCINTIRTLSMDAVQKANSGHPGTPMALAPLGFTIFDRFMKFNPQNPEWPNRDRFVLSAGHASMLLYSLLHIMGYDLNIEDIKNFRQLQSKTPGHPENFHTPGVETTTGPLGQGAATSVGFAIAEKWLENYFNRPKHRIVDYNIFVVTSDGDMMEGITSEAASLAGHLGLDNLVWFYDNNSITIEGETDLSFSEDVGGRFRAYNWYVQEVKNANDTRQIEKAVENALKEKGKPSLIIVDSFIAFGSPNKQGTADAHGSPLGDDEIRQTKLNYGWNPDVHFFVPPEVSQYTEQTREKGRRLEEDWNRKFEEYEKEYPEPAKHFRTMQKRDLPENWDCCIPEFPADEKGIAGRSANGKILNALAEQIPWLMGGSSDLAPSTKTLLAKSESFARGNYGGRNLHFGIRENAMAAISNGLSLSKLRPFASTFLIFSDYLRPSLRLSALMKEPVIYIFSHDSIGLGEDGPTHQPVEHLASLRAMPNVDVIRPADANEIAVMWRYILPLADRPVVLALSRQELPTIDRDKYNPADGALRGAYILADCGNSPDLILISTGSEVHLCLEAYEKLMEMGIKTRVVSMPCWSIFEMQSDEYKNTILPKEVKNRIAVEAGAGFGWWRYVGVDDGHIVGLTTFGASAPLKKLYEQFGITVERIIEASKEVMERKRTVSVSL
jgi:transketolase